MKYYFTKEGLVPFKGNSRELFNRLLNVDEEVRKYPKVDFEKMLEHPNLVVLGSEVMMAELSDAHKISFGSTAAFLHDHRDALDMTADKGWSLVLHYIEPDTSNNQGRYYVYFSMFDAKILNALVRPFTIDKFLKENK